MALLIDFIIRECLVIISHKSFITGHIKNCQWGRLIAGHRAIVVLTEGMPNLDPNLLTDGGSGWLVDDCLLESLCKITTDWTTLTDDLPVKRSRRQHDVRVCLSVCLSVCLCVLLGVVLYVLIAFLRVRLCLCAFMYVRSSVYDCMIGRYWDGVVLLFVTFMELLD